MREFLKKVVGKGLEWIGHANNLGWLFSILANNLGWLFTVLVTVTGISAASLTAYKVSVLWMLPLSLLSIGGTTLVTRRLWKKAPALAYKGPKLVRHEACGLRWIIWADGFTLTNRPMTPCCPLCDTEIALPKVTEASLRLKVPVRIRCDRDGCGFEMPMDVPQREFVDRARRQIEAELRKQLPQAPMS